MRDDFDDDDYGYDDGPDDPCEHDEQYVDVDILSGRAHCMRCGHAWWMSTEELDAELQFQIEAHEAMEREAAEGEVLARSGEDA